MPTFKTERQNNVIMVRCPRLDNVVVAYISDGSYILSLNNTPRLTNQENVELKDYIQAALKVQEGKEYYVGQA